MQKISLTDEEIRELERQVGVPVTAIETFFGTAVFRLLTPEEYKKSLAMARNEREKATCERWTATKARVHPDEPTFNAWVAKKPGITKAADGPIMRLTGMDQHAPGEISDDLETVTVKTIVGAITLKTPDEFQWARYRRLVEDGQLYEAWENLALSCALTPSREELKKLFNERPGLPSTLTPHISTLAGFEENERGKE